MTRRVGMRKNSAACALRRCRYANTCARQPAKPGRGSAPHQVPAEEERAVLDSNTLQSALTRTAQRLAHVGRLHEAEARAHGVHVRHAAPRCARARRAIVARRAQQLDVQDHDVLVARRGCARGCAAAPSARSRGWLTRNTAVPGTCVAPASSFGSSRPAAPRVRCSAARSARAAVAPGHETHEHASSRAAAAPSRRSRILVSVARDEREVEDRNSAERRGDACHASQPHARARDDHAEDRRDRHRADHRGAVGAASARPTSRKPSTKPATRRRTPARSRRARRSGRARRRRSAGSCTRGSRSSCTAWRVSENAPEIVACDAMIVAAVASSTSNGSSRARREREERIRDRGSWRRAAARPGRSSSASARARRARTRRAAPASCRSGPCRRTAPRRRSTRGTRRRGSRARRPGDARAARAHSPGLAPRAPAARARSTARRCTPSVANQSTMIGPNSRRRARCRGAGSRTATSMITSVTGTTALSTCRDSGARGLRPRRKHRDRGRDQRVAVEERGAEHGERDERRGPAPSCRASAAPERAARACRLRPRCRRA